MLSGLARLLAILVVSGIFLADASAQQVAPGKPAPLKRIEPGLEEAVQWEWKVTPSDEKDSGLPVSHSDSSADPDANHQGSPAREPAHFVRGKKGRCPCADRKKIQSSRWLRFEAFNGLKGDMIRAGQTLKIPTLVEVSAMAPPTPPPKKHQKTGT